MNKIILALAAISFISTAAVAKERDELPPFKSQAVLTVTSGFATLDTGKTAYDKAMKLVIIEGRNK